MLLTSCVATWNLMIPKDVKSSIKYCYDGKLTRLDTIIKIHGYYTMTYPFDRWEINEKRYVKDTGTVNFVFYPNGLFLYRIHNYSENLNDYLKRVASNQNQKETKDFYRFFWWGNYVIESDTIKTFNFDPPGTMSWGGSEIWFVVNEDKTLSEIFATPMRNETDTQKASYKQLREEYMKRLSPAKFYYVDSMPEPDYSWILSAKWFKCKEK